MLYIAIATGLITLILTAAVYRFRRTPPPATFTAAAIVLGLLPLALLGCHWAIG